MTRIEKQLISFKKKHGYLPNYFNVWNKKEIKDACPALTVKCGDPYSINGLLIIEKE